MRFKYALGATPLDLNEIEGLIPEHINTQSELNEWEKANILKAEMWLSRFRVRRQLTMDSLLTHDFIKKVHHKMFNDTWRWAGKFMKSNKNIGVDWIHIPVKLYELLADVFYQVKNHTYEIDEIAARLHHRLVAIHPFPNGNGRHARFFTHIFLKVCGQPLFSWGQKSLNENSELRR